nr:uncharacterized protein LOC113707087 [Coffea arabica]
MEDEIHDALFSMNPEKAPGQDGMTPLFFQKFWNTIKSDIILAIKAFFTQANKNEAVEIMKVLKTYENASGQLVNLDKSAVFFSKNMYDEQKKEGEVNGKNKMDWLSWERITMAKSAGGLDFKDIETFNQALSGKQVWRILTKPNLLVSKVLKARYSPQESILQCSLSKNAS